MRLAPIQQYHAPSSLQECLELLSSAGDRGLVLAGGQSAMQQLKARERRPQVLVDLRRIDALRSHGEVDGGGVELGAMVRYRTILENRAVLDRWPALTDATRTIGDLQVRNRGTIGGNLAWADIASDLPPVVVCLGGEVRVVGPAGERTVAADRFVTGNRRTTLQHGEVLTAVRLPAAGRSTGSAYVKYGITANGRPVIGVAAQVRLDDAGGCSSARIVVGGVADGPSRASRAEEALRGSVGGAEDLQEAGRLAAEEVATHGDHRSSAEYRQQLIRVYVSRGLQQAFARAQGGPGQ